MPGKITASAALAEGSATEATSITGVYCERGGHRRAAFEQTLDHQTSV